MRGDFSSFWNKEDKLNFNGVLHQQGRVLLDRDWNAQTEILNDWQEIAAQDIIGARVAAVPWEAKESFKVTKAKITSATKIEVWINKGHVWADGLLIHLNENIKREATYLEPPVQKPQAQISEIANGVRDAVVLEAWHEELNAFQQPKLLVEPALGGVDTTERMQTAFRFRLYRMGKDETCDSIIEKLNKQHDKGRLTVTLQPDNQVDKDCPVVSDGGYTGFEHRLCRVEIARTNRAGQTWFKWSQFNGGLVGRGTFDNTNRVVKIEANSNAIHHSGLNNFYLETLEFDEEQNFWRVQFGARVSLDIGNNTLKLPQAAQEAADVFFGSVATMDQKNVFFRLWNDIRQIKDANENELQDGIFLKFDTLDAEKYTAHDYWTFEVRAGDVENNQVEIIGNKPTLVNNKPPEGIFYHRVPLAELNWQSGAVGSEITFDSGFIEDCRRIFQPLTKLSTCCTFRVGDGVTSHGDFTRIQDAINNLPKAGGQICVLPGEYRENIVIAAPRNRNITIKGCGTRSHLVGGDGKPAILIFRGANLSIESLKITAGRQSSGILLEGDEITAQNQQPAEKLLRNINLEKLHIEAGERTAIELHVGQFVSVRQCQISVRDVQSEWAAVYLAGDDLLFAENEIRVLNEFEFRNSVKINDLAARPPARAAVGGLHLGGGCERVRVINNLIIGGTGNGINLGGINNAENGEIVVHHKPWRARGGQVIRQDFINDELIKRGFIAAAPLSDIWIEHNRIFGMGRNGIGVDAFFASPRRANNADDIELISVENLAIINNQIKFCLNLHTPDISEAMTNLIGYGGISLAAVENAVVRDNFIADNGVEHLEPVCGIFILHGEGIEILRNRILNNGRFVAELAQKEIRNGARGGIYIVQGFSASTLGDEARDGDFFPGGAPALKLHENIVSVPVGRSLVLTAIGQVSVVGNQFLRQTILSGRLRSLESVATNILIINLSISPEFYHATLKLQNIKDRSATAAGATENALLSNRHLFSGNTIFAHNQCQTVSGGAGEIVGLSSILIFSLDDVGFLGNNVHCVLKGDAIFFDTILLAVTLRASDNRWQEQFARTIFSAVTFGVLNTTTDNQSTHCLLILGMLCVNKYNLTFPDLLAVLSRNLPCDFIELERNPQHDFRSPCERGRT